MVLSCTPSEVDSKSASAAADEIKAAELPPLAPAGLSIAPSVAGAFYPADKAALGAMIKGYLDQAQKKDLLGLWGLVSPHAGYVFSAPIAASAFKQVEGASFKTVVVIAFSHRPFYEDGRPIFNGVATVEADTFDTPLGPVAVDLEAVHALRRDNPEIGSSPALFSGEHSLEVELPFIKTVLPDAKLVPIMFGLEYNLDAADKLAGILYKQFGRNADVLFVASTDLSHYFPYETARELDQATCKMIETFDIEQLTKRAMSGNVDCCGLLPVLTMLRLQQIYGGPGPQTLDLRNSGDISGDKSKVVGYAAIAFLRDTNALNDEQIMLKKGTEMAEYDLNREQKKKLLDLARNTVETYVKEHRRVKADITDSLLLQNGAAFVTLKKKGDLRGCIGHVEAVIPLVDCIQEMALAACSKDTRFTPVETEELPLLEYEISVLTPMKKITSVDEIEVGTHGLLMERGYHRGLLLPQVPVEWGWNRDEFLRQTCRKAGLPPDAWKDKDVTIYSFKALVFSEDDLDKI